MLWKPFKKLLNDEILVNERCNFTKKFASKKLGQKLAVAIQRYKMFDEKNDRKRKWTKNLLSYCVNYSVTCHEYFWWRRQSLAEALFRQIPFEQFRMETFHGKDDWSWHLPIAQGCWLRQTHCPRCNVQNPAAAVEYSFKIKVLALLKRKNDASINQTDNFNVKLRGENHSSFWVKSGLISERILSLVPLPTKSAKSLPWAENSNKLFTVMAKLGN